MKKIIRIILSPLVFIFIFCAMIAIPIGPLALIMGLGIRLYSWIIDDKKETIEWQFVFAWICLPYEETGKFIKGERLS